MAAGHDVPSSPGGVRIDRVVTSGVFELDGGSWEVDNNVWVIGDDSQCYVIDAAHNADQILQGVAGRELLGIICTHGHNDHINAVADLQVATTAPSYLHPSDQMLWDAVYPDGGPDRALSDGEVLTVADVDLQVLHTPGHAPGAVCLYAPQLGVLFSGDTLFNGGPGATGRSYSDFPTIVQSIQDRLLSLPGDTVVLTGHGDSTRIGDEASQVEEWLRRGH